MNLDSGLLEDSAAIPTVQAEPNLWFFAATLVFNQIIIMMSLLLVFIIIHTGHPSAQVQHLIGLRQCCPPVRALASAPSPLITRTT